MSTLPANIAQCNFFHPTGLRCGSPALRDSDFCHWHQEIAYVHHVYLKSPPSPFIDLPALDSPEAVQLAVMTVTQALLDNRIKEKRAGLLLYAIQIAAANLRHMAKSNDIQEQLVKQQAEAAALPQEPASPPDPEEEAKRAAFENATEQWRKACVKADETGDAWPDFYGNFVPKIHACADQDYPAPSSFPLRPNRRAGAKSRFLPFAALRVGMTIRKESGTSDS